MPTHIVERISKGGGRHRSPPSVSSRPLVDGVDGMSSAGDSQDVPSLSNFEIRSGRRCRLHRAGLLLLLLLVSGILLAAIIATALGLRARFYRPPPTVLTPCGPVTGRLEADVYSFLGLPYALPPVGEYRFRRPRDLYARTDCAAIFKASESAKAFRPACPQRRPFESGRLVGSADCLYLNVYSPDIRSGAQRPVVVVLGGLFFLYGSGHAPGFRVTPGLVKATDAVHVTLNYRLGAHGFVPLGGGGEANLGLWDIVSALRWVQSFIWRFGGDPNNVMLFGYGSGATSALVLSMATSTVTFDLFHKVWLASPMLRVERSVQEATLEYKRALGCTSRECLTNMTDLKLASMLSMSNDLRRGWFELPQTWRPQRTPGILLVDKMLIRESPSNATHHRLKNIPFVIGSTTNEVDVYLSPVGVRLWEFVNYQQYINASLKPSSDDFRTIMSLYPLSSGTLEDVFTRLVSDARVTCPLLCYAKGLHTRARLVYQYVVRGISRYVQPYNFQLRVNNSFHGWDALLYFSDGHLDRLASADSSTEASMRDRLRLAVRQFSRTGQVKEFQRGGVNMIDINSIQHFKDYKAAECKLWHRVANGSCYNHGWAT